MKLSSLDDFFDDWLTLSSAQEAEVQFYHERSSCRKCETDDEEILKYGKREIVFYRWRQLGGEVVEMQEVGKGTNPPRQSGRVVHFWQAADYHDRQSQQDDHRMIRGSS